MSLVRRMIPLVAAVAALAPAAGHAQANLFSREHGTRDYQTQLYEATVRKGMNATLAAWHDAWERDDPDAIARLYLEDATVFTPEGTVQGRDAIAAYYRRILPDRAGLRSFPLHFNASGVLAYTVELNTMHIGTGDDERTWAERNFLVLRQQWNDTWLIESQLTAEVQGDAAGH